MKQKNPVFLEFNKIFMRNIIPTIKVCQIEASNDQSWVEEEHYDQIILLGILKELVNIHFLKSKKAWIAYILKKEYSSILYRVITKISVISGVGQTDTSNSMLNFPYRI